MGEKTEAGQWVEGRRVVVAVEPVVVCGSDLSGTGRKVAGHWLVVVGGWVALWVEI